jgi:hypothetical protein
MKKSHMVLLEAMLIPRHHHLLHHTMNLSLLLVSLQQPLPLL